MKGLYLTAIAVVGGAIFLYNAVAETKVAKEPNPKMSAEELEKMETATLGAGCFWCIEAVLERIKGIGDVESGYTGGHVKNPTYEQITTKTTGHAEVVRVKFDPEVITYEEVLEVFWEAHDPTTLNRQGNDVGPQYRSAIYYHSEEQKKIAEKSKEKAQSKFDDPIVTEITEAPVFYSAEGYHQDFFTNNQSHGYCRAIIWPKLKKLGLLKEE